MMVIRAGIKKNAPKSWLVFSFYCGDINDDNCFLTIFRIPIEREE